MAMTLLCSLLLIVIAALPLTLEAKRKRRLSPFILAALLDVTVIPSVFVVARGMCPIPMKWILHVILFCGLAFTERLRPHRAVKKDLSPIVLKTFPFNS